MSAIGTGYDLSVTTYSPDGRLFQVEYAAKAAERSGTAIGLRVKDGIVLAAEKLYGNVMLESTSNGFIHSVDRHVGLTFAGIYADGRQALKLARSECRTYKEEFNDPVTGKVLAERMANHFNTYTLYSHLRPFGCALILGSYHEAEGARLYMVEPAGISYGYYGVSVGKAATQARTEIEKLKISELTVEQAIDEAARILLKGHDEIKDKLYMLEISYISAASNYQHEICTEQRIAQATERARAALSAEEND